MKIKDFSKNVKAYFRSKKKEIIIFEQTIIERPTQLDWWVLLKEV